MEVFGIRVTVAPVTLPVTPTEFIDHARLNGITVALQPTLIDRMLKAAVNRAQTYMRRALMPQTIETSYISSQRGCGCQPLTMWLPRGEIRSITTVKQGAEVIPPESYTLYGNTIELEYSLGGPATALYVAGYADEDSIPSDILEGVLEYAMTLYEDRQGKRETKQSGATPRPTLPDGVQDLWRPYVVEWPQ